MTSDQLRKKIWLNSISNYLRTGLRMILGLLMFRMLFPKPGGHGLTKEEFGFWSLLWSVFGYGILMDFGFGLAAQKKVAELSVRKNWDQLSRVLSTIFFFYFVSAAIIITFVLLFSHQLIGFISFDYYDKTTICGQFLEQNFHLNSLWNVIERHEFRPMLVIFLCFIGLSFPVGISIEILYGQQRIALANNLASIGAIVNFGLVVAAIYLQWGLQNIIIIGLTTALIPSIIGGYMGLRLMPAVKLLPKYFSWPVLKETMRFSIFAYIGIVTTVIMSQTDMIILARYLSVSAVGVYKVGSKLLDIFYNFTLQLPETISPAAAHLHAQGDKTALQRLLIDGTRFNVMLGTPLYLLCAFFFEGLVKILTKGQAPDPQTFWTGQVLLFWGYTSIITHSISKKIFMMCDQERKLVQLSAIEAIANLGLSLGLVLYFRTVVCVAIGTLIPTLIIGWFFLWPWAAKDCNLTGWQLAGRVLHRNWYAAVPLIIFGALCRWVPVLDFRNDTLTFLLEASLAGVIAGLSLWRWGLSEHERAKILSKLPARFVRFGRKKPA